VKKETKRNIAKGAKIVLAILTFPLHVLIMGGDGLGVLLQEDS
jgi:hypothetical protein